MSRVFDLQQLKPEHFESLVGAPLALADSELAFTVQAVQRLNAPSPRADPFVLSLMAPTGSNGPQGNYNVVHPQLGAMTMFLVPVAIVDGRALFESVFN